MFLTTRPSPKTIQDFLDRARRLPLSYKQIGLNGPVPLGFRVDDASMRLGEGERTFELGKRALSNWEHFKLGWVELFPRDASIAPATIVAVLVKHVGFWSLNGCRVLYQIDENASRFGFAYGTLTDHAEMGEEIFEVSFNPETEDVVYRIQAISRPRAMLARLALPVTRSFQARFRRDSLSAMKRAVEK